MSEFFSTLSILELIDQQRKQVKVVIFSVTKYSSNKVKSHKILEKICEMQDQKTSSNFVLFIYNYCADIILKTRL